MEATSPQVFICYARSDADRIGRLGQALSRAGCSPWIDRREILVGEDWRNSLSRGIQSSHFFLVALSFRSFDRRGETQREIQFALDLWRAYLPSDIFILPVRMEDCQIPEQLRGFQTVDLFEDGGFAELISSIQEGLRRRNLFIALRLRSKPYHKYSQRALRAMLARRGFFERRWNFVGRGPLHLFSDGAVEGVPAVVDYGTNLVWQKEGTDCFGGGMRNAEEAKAEVAHLNSRSNGRWRLPTVEEAASLLTPYQSREGLFVPDAFADSPFWIWTCDAASAHRPWSVDFGKGECCDYVYGNAWPGVLAVQSLVITPGARS